jgi:hypothetical protein
VTNRDLVHRLQECFNSRRFDDAAALHAPDFVSHPLGTTGFGTQPWRLMTTRYPRMRVVARDILVDSDKAAVRSAVEGVPGADGATPELFEIFRITDGRFTEMWGASTGFPPLASPEAVTG